MSGEGPSEAVEIGLRDLLDLLERQVGDVLHVEALEGQRFDEMRGLVLSVARASEDAVRQHAPGLMPRLQRVLDNLKP